MEWEIINFDDISIENRGRYLSWCFYGKVEELLKE